MGRHGRLSKISYQRFARAARRCRTLSRQAIPKYVDTILRYKTRTHVLFARDLYVVRFTDRLVTKILGWDHPRAHAITLHDFATSFPRVMRNGKAKLGLPKRLTIFLLTCTECDRSVIIDGNHRMSRLSRAWRDVPATVYELAGSRWRDDTPDMGVVCGCP